MATKYFQATLVRGRVYILSGDGKKRVEFWRDKAVKVTDAVKKHLEKYAMDPIMEHDPREDRPIQIMVQKFKFEAVSASKEVTDQVPGSA